MNYSIAGFDSTTVTSERTNKPGYSVPRGHFEIQSLEWLRQNRPSPARERLSCHEIIWFQSAPDSISIDSRRYELGANTIVCFMPGQWRSYESEGEMSGYRISFSPDFLYMGAGYTKLAAWLDTYGEGSPAPILGADGEMQKEMNEIMDKMQKEFTNYYLLRSELLAGLLNILIIHISRRLNPVATDNLVSKETELVRRFRALLKEHFTTRKQVADYAGELCVTPNYLNRTVKKITGFTASHHIQQQIILEAKRRVIHSNVSMKEIAYFLGFDNLAHFSKFFKNNSGMSFSNFKREQAAFG